MVKSSMPAPNWQTTSASSPTAGAVLCVTALGETVAQAQQRAYQLLTDIHWDGSFSRNDIGWRAIEREKANG